MMKFTKRRGMLPAGIAAALVVAGAAFAFWTGNGSGSGSGSAATGVSALTANQATTLAAMYPGDSAQTISGDFDNSNSGPVYVSTVTVSISGVTKAAGAPAGTCDATDFTLANAAMSVGGEVAAGTGEGSFTGATLKFNDKPATNQDACKGATVSLSYTIA
jgi:hypothetical protein